MPAVTLDIGKVFAGAFLVPWWQRRQFVRALAGPLTAMAVLMLGWYFADETFPAWLKWVLCAAYVGLFAVFAVACHRLVLLDARRVRPGVGWREFRFLFWLVGAFLVYFGIMLAAWTVILNIAGALPGARGDMSLWAEWTRPVAVIPALYVMARLSPILPAVALDRDASLRWAWTLTRGNGWRLFAVVAILPWALAQLLGLLYRTNPTPVETIALTVIGIALFAVEIAALSISYKELTAGDANEHPG